MDSVKKFQELLKELFQFEASDLDFGIYRILNYKREQIKEFIEQVLVKRVEEAFSKHKDARLSNITQKFEEAKKKVIDQLNPNVFTASGELKDEFKNTNVGKDYLAIKAQKDEVEKIDEIKLQVFNDLYSFFSRYYEEGDIAPKYRYSIKNYKYAIPYNGEEVKLYWANSDQYYTKTGLLFRDYTFFSDPAKTYKIIFRTVAAKEELGSNKATKERFFILDNENPIELDKKTLVIRFQYRELDSEEVRKYNVAGGSNTAKQEKINQETTKKIVTKVEEKDLKVFLTKEYKNEKILLLYQILRFAAKNTKDFFIHKNLKKFLSEQLDYFIKAELLSIETIEKEKFLDKHITRAKVVREIGESIIDFLAQIEDFQKKLWEKKKFVLQTQYVITSDRTPEEFYEQIFNDKQQREEWKELGFDLPKNKIELKKKTLPIDTRYFEPNFKEKLLERLSEKADLDDLLDGTLIKSENWQALNLILTKFKERIQCIYIDPPFNTGKDFLYKDNYQDSSWLTLMENRLIFVKRLLIPKGAFYLHLDENANYYGRILLDKLGFDNTQEIFFNTNATKDEEADLYGYKSFGNRYVLKHNTIFYCFNNHNFFNKLWKPNRNETKLDIGWLDLIAFANKANPKKVKDFDYFIERYDKNGKFGLEKIEVNEKIYPLGDLWHDIYSFTQSEMRTSENLSFLTQKPEHLIRRMLQASSKQSDYVLDYFAGSGTTLAVAQKLKRKWLGVELGEYFNEFYIDHEANDKSTKLGIMGRLKVVLYGDKDFLAVDKKRRSHLSKDINWQGGGFFKYHYLEQYEDSLDNLELVTNKQAELKFGTDYLLQYFLDFETKENTTLLNIDLLKKPFSYKLKANLEEAGEPQLMNVDLVETFNYLLGLKINKYKTREPNGKKYVFVLGEKQGKNIAIVWREYEENWSKDDFKKDKELIVQELESWAPHIVYINGQSNLTPQLGKHNNVEIRYIEPEFKSLMG